MTVTVRVACALFAVPLSIGLPDDFSKAQPRGNLPADQGLA